MFLAAMMPPGRRYPVRFDEAVLDVGHACLFRLSRSGSRRQSPRRRRTCQKLGVTRGEGKLIRAEDAAVVAALAPGTPEWEAHFGGYAVTDNPLPSFSNCESRFETAV